MKSHTTSALISQAVEVAGAEQIRYTESKGGQQVTRTYRQNDRRHYWKGIRDAISKQLGTQPTNDVDVWRKGRTRIKFFAGDHFNTFSVTVRQNHYKR